MINHIVLFSLKTSVSRAEANSIFAGIAALKKLLPGILSIATGPCDFHPDSAIPGFTHGFSIDFKDEQALQEFFDSRAAWPIKKKIIESVVNGEKGIVGFSLTKVI